MRQKELEGIRIGLDEKSTEVISFSVSCRLDLHDFFCIRKGYARILNEGKIQVKEKSQLKKLVIALILIVTLASLSPSVNVLAKKEDPSEEKYINVSEIKLKYVF